MRKLSIALVRQRYTYHGGAERFVTRTLQSLSGLDLSLTLITRAWSAADGFEVLTCDPFYLGRVWRDWSFARCACGEVANRHFDLVQSHERMACCDIYRAGDGVHREWLRQLSRVRGLAGGIGLAFNPYHQYVRWAESRLFGSARLKAVICNSVMVKAEIGRNFGVPDAMLHVIYNGVDLEAFHPRLAAHRADIRRQHDIPMDAPLFLFVGSGFERKGVKGLLEAFAQLPDNGHLLIVGRDKRQRQFANRARRLGLGTRAHFLGSQPDVGPYYGAADAFVLPTLYDPFPNAILEAMASGLPVVTSTKCGAAEIIEHGRNGFVCDALDHNALADAMRQLSVPATRAAIGVAARETVSSMSVENARKEMMALYTQLTNHAG